MATNSGPVLTPETVGDRVYDPKDFVRYSPDAATLVRFYGEDPDVNMVIWNLEPGQENHTHAHADFAQAFVILCGDGVLLRGAEGEPVDIKAGQVVINPRTRMHGIRNTGSERLSYLAISTRSVSQRTPS
jgi:mannose-6-phosphate isomerase-like protein (cupin superfamily)